MTLRALNVQLLYHEISARKLDNATLVGSPSRRGRERGKRETAANKKERKSPRAHKREEEAEEIGTRSLYGGAAAVAAATLLRKCSHLITHAI